MRARPSVLGSFAVEQLALAFNTPGIAGERTVAANDTMAGNGDGKTRSYPNYPLPYRWLAAALGQLGRTEEAGEALEKAIAISPSSFEMYVRTRVPWMRPEDYVHMLEGLRKAGWRET